MEGYHGEIMNKRQAKKKRDKLIIAGRTHKGARLKKRNDKKIWGMLKKNFGNCEKLRSLTIYNQRKKTEDITLKNGRKKICTRSVGIANISILHSNVNYV